MSWMDNLNLVVEYIEENLDKEISYNVASKIMNVSVYHMQKLFACIIGIPISEYIRKRRLTKAAFDLQCGIKVIDVALKYGYTSPTAFTRAFKLQHNMSPSEVKKSINNLVSYPPITFKLIIQGVEGMKYRIVKKDEIKIVGVKTKISSDFEKNFNNIPKFWSDVFSKNIICELIPMMNQDLKGVLGVSIMNDNQIDGYYYIGVATDQEPPEGMESILIKSSEGQSLVVKVHRLIFKIYKKE